MEQELMNNNELYPNETIRAITEFLFMETPLNEIGVCDLTIVLGNDYIDGTMKEVRRLIDLGVISKKGKVILSGATGSLDSGKPKECIRLFRSGVDKYNIPPRLLVLEDRATNCYQNFEFTKALIEADQKHFRGKNNLDSFERILIIGKAFMLRRAQMCARKLAYPMDKLAFFGTVDREGRNIGKDCWWKSETARMRVYGEIERIGKYAASGDLSVF